MVWTVGVGLLRDVVCLFIGLVFVVLIVIVDGLIIVLVGVLLLGRVIFGFLFNMFVCCNILCNVGMLLFYCFGCNVVLLVSWGYGLVL